MIGAIGKDDGYWMSLLYPAMEACAIDVTGIVEVAGSTGVAVIIVDEGEGGENRILLSPGANYAGMEASDVLRRAWKYPLPEVMVLQAEIPIESVVHVLRVVNGKGVDVVFNPAPVPPGGFPDDIFDGLAHLIVNETEAEQLGPKRISRGRQDAEETKLAAEHFHSLGVRNVIITLGSRGVYVSAATEPHTVRSPDTTYTEFIPAEKVEKLVDTTAAGDTFVGAYAVEVARWKAGGRQGEDDTQDGAEAVDGDTFDVRRAVMLANKAASVCVQRKGAMDSVPWEDEVFGLSPKNE
jgi:ribokinase